MSPEKLRARVLAEWRGVPDPAFPRHTAKPVGETLTKLMASLGLGERLREQEVLEAWREIVGEFVARHASPERLKDGVLIVHVLQPTMRFELERMWKREIVAKLKSRFGARVVRDIRFRHG